MSVNHTTHYGLSLWAGTDPVLHTDFNADNTAIDTALHALAQADCKLAAGSYTGNASYTRYTSAATSQTISLSFTPDVVLVFPPVTEYPWINTGDNTHLPRGSAVAAIGSLSACADALAITNGGFLAKQTYTYSDLLSRETLASVNDSGVTYLYLAIKLGTS